MVLISRSARASPIRGGGHTFIAGRDSTVISMSTPTEPMARKAVRAMIVMSATGSGRCHGFSLIELLVVLLIMVLLTGLLPLAIERMVPARRVAAVCQDLES